MATSSPRPAACPPTRRVASTTRAHSCSGGSRRRWNRYSPGTNSRLRTLSNSAPRSTTLQARRIANSRTAVLKSFSPRQVAMTERTGSSEARASSMTFCRRTRSVPGSKPTNRSSVS